MNKIKKLVLTLNEKAKGAFAFFIFPQYVLIRKINKSLMWSTPCLMSNWSNSIDYARFSYWVGELAQLGGFCNSNLNARRF